MGNKQANSNNMVKISSLRIMITMIIIKKEKRHQTWFSFHVQQKQLNFTQPQWLITYQIRNDKRFLCLLEEI